MTEQAPVRLTSYCQAAGCAAKFAPADLEATLAGLSTADGDGFASSLESRDDAGWIDLGDRILLQSVDFFTPVVDDPHRFGQIAAANALSDIYAMGGEPLTAMNLVCFPRELDLGILREILAGGGAKIEEAGRGCAGDTRCATPSRSTASRSPARWSAKRWSETAAPAPATCSC